MLIFLLNLCFYIHKLDFLVLIFGGLLGLDIKVKVVILVSNGCCNRLSQTGWLDIRNLLSYSSEGWKSEMKVDMVGSF